MKNSIPILLTLGGALAASAAALNACVVADAASDIRTAEETAGRNADAILVLGAGIKPDGRLSDMLDDRMKVAVDCYHRGAGHRLLLSGDGRPGYDEPAAMRRAALRAGIPDEAILLDRGGVSTSASILRARVVFGFRSLVIVTQEYHLYRALFLARNEGLSAVGVSADLRPYRSRRKQAVREFLARCKDAAKTLGM